MEENKNIESTGEQKNNTGDSGSSAAESVPQPKPQPETINQKPETENMEVHHHAHDPAAPHHKKN